MAVCAAFDATRPYVGEMLAYADCQALSLGEAGYRALGAGSPFGMALTGLLTIFVALIGYGLLLGSQLTVREAALAALKVGIVLALATQWSAYRTVIFDLATRAPEQAATEFLAPQGLGSQGSFGLAARIDGVSGALAELLDQASNASPANPTPIAAKGLSSSAVKSLESASSILVTAALAGLLSVRLVLALLLGLGPLFLGAMLFDGTRGLFAGWLRTIAGAALGALAVPMILSLQLSILEPQVLALRAQIDAGRPLGAMPQQILGTASVFALVMLAALASAMWAVAALRLPSSMALAPLPRANGDRQLSLPPPEWFATRAGAADASGNRALMLAGAAQATDWRGERIRQASEPNLRLALPHGELTGAAQGGFAPVPAPLGQQGRRPVRRYSQASIKRDELK